MKKIPFRKTYLTLTLLTAFLAFLGWHSLRNTANEPIPRNDQPASLTTENAVDEHAKPGYYAQWFDEKKNEKGIIPYGLDHQWRTAVNGILNGRNTPPTILTNFLEIGPSNVGGRTKDIHVDYFNANRIFAGAAGGGLWRSDDGGSSFAPVDDRAASLNVSSICQSPFSGGPIYFGTGNTGGAPGEGLFKSTDGGLTFSVMTATLAFPALERMLKVEHARAIGQEDVLYIGTKAGKVLKTTDAGINWQVVYTSPNGEAIRDMVAFPDGSILLAEQKTGLIRFDPILNTFSAVPNVPYPSGVFRRIEIENCAVAAPNTVYALIEGPKPPAGTTDPGPVAFLKSTDAGLTWTGTGLATPASGTAQGSFALVLGVAPDNPNRIMAGSLRPKISLDGGVSWGSTKNFHADYHGFAAHPGDPTQFLVANDGGIGRAPWVTSSPSTAGTGLDAGYAVTQFHGGDYAPSGDVAVGGAQDNGSWRVTPGSQQKVGSNDGGYCYSHKQNLDVAYRSWQGSPSSNGPIQRYTNFLGSGNFPTQLINKNVTMDAEKYDFINFFNINNTDGEQVYCRTNKALWRTITAGGSGGTAWTRLTNSNKSFIKKIGMSNEDDPVLFFGGKNGKVFRINNAKTAIQGTEFDLGSLTAPPHQQTISSILVHPQDNNVIFVTFGTVDNNPRVYRVDNALSISSATPPVWTSISGDLPAELPVNDIKVHPQSPDNIMFAGTDHGLFYTVNGGATWFPEVSIPAVKVKELKLRTSDNSLWAITYGRGIWKMEIESCPLISVFPLHEGFEDPQAVTWHNATGDDFDWTRNTGGTPTSNTGPASANEGNWYVYTEVDGNTGGQIASINSYCLDLSGMDFPLVDWYYHMSGSNVGKLSLDISTDGGLTFTNDVWWRAGNQGSNWLQATVDLSPIPVALQTQVVLRFKVETAPGSNTEGDIAIDQIRVTKPLSPVPTNISLVETESEVPFLYPNPSHDRVKVELPKSWKGETSLNLIDYEGRLLAHELISDGSRIKEFDLSNLKAGMYLVRVINGKNSQTLRLVVQ